MTDGAVLAIVREYTGGANISPDMKFDELGIDSLEFISIVREVEEALHVQIPDSALQKISTVRDLAREALSKSR